MMMGVWVIFGVSIRKIGVAEFFKGFIPRRFVVVLYTASSQRISGPSCSLKGGVKAKLYGNASSGMS